jgi:hypothetical protein
MCSALSRPKNKNRDPRTSQTGGHRDDRNIVGIIKKERTIMPLPSTPHENRAAKGEEAKERAAARKAALKKDADDGITGKA